ncbi:MAG: CehA/McbA family metallohydrolase [Anaerolineae bacterium]
MSFETFHEYVGNLHVHTTYSDGGGSHRDVLEAAGAAGLDFVVVTDHNVLVHGLEGWYETSSGRRVLLLIGEEVHDMRRSPQVNHLLVYNVRYELAPYAPSPQNLIDRVGESDGGLCFIAHPDDQPNETFGEPGICWDDWSVSGFTGLELWNYMSELKSHLTSRMTAMRAVMNPDRYISGPHPETLARWDEMLKAGRFIRVIGNSDAHATTYRMGPIERVVFPYEYLFRCVNTHILTRKPLSGELDADRETIFNALRTGSSWVGYDLPASTEGFRFSSQGHNFSTIMGGEIKLGHGVTLQMGSPRIADMRLIHDGEMVAQETEGTHHTYIASKPGMYRVEVYIEHQGRPRGWIFSNPIHVFK